MFFFVFSLVPFYEITQGSGATRYHKTICANTHKELLQKACAHIQMCSFTHIHTHQLNQSLKVSEASISFCKSATIRRWVLFPLSGCWALTRRQEVIYCFCLSSCWLPATHLWFEANRKQHRVVDLQEAHSAAGIWLNSLLRPSSPQILNVSRFRSFLPLLFFNNGRIKMKTCEGTRGEWVPINKC